MRVRMCPGRHIVDMTLWIFVASVVSVLDVRRAKDKLGNDVPLDCEFTGALVR